jgi:hypothetical protein
MITPMLRPDLFGALATHAGDALFELCYAAEHGKVVRALRPYDGDILRWWDDFRSRTSFVKEEDAVLIDTLGYAAAYSPDEHGTPVLPFDPRTGRLRDDVWARWLAWDPVRMVDTYADALRGLHSIWIDAGTEDEWYLDCGAEAFREALRAIGVADDVVAFELFQATHMNIGYRYPPAVAWLAPRLHAAVE